MRSFDKFIKKRETSEVEVIQEAMDYDHAPGPSQALEKGEGDAEVNSEYEAEAEVEGHDQDEVVEEPIQEKFIKIGDFGCYPFGSEDENRRHLREKIVKKGSNHFQNKNGPFIKDKKGRWMTSAWFSNTLPNCRKQNQIWIAYPRRLKLLIAFHASLQQDSCQQCVIV